VGWWVVAGGLGGCHVVRVLGATALGTHHSGANENPPLCWLVHNSPLSDVMRWNFPFEDSLGKFPHTIVVK